MTPKAEDRIAAAFAIPELLENIICQLPEQSILTSATRVCKFWKILIDESPTIQRKLYFTASAAVVKPYQYWPNSVHTVPQYESVRLNPLIHASPWSYGISETPYNQGYALDRIAGDRSMSFPLDICETDKPAMSQTCASWRRMYLTQPPCSQLYILLDYRKEERTSLVYKDECGITLGRLDDFVVRAARTHAALLYFDQKYNTEHDFFFDVRAKQTGLTEKHSEE